MESIDVGDIVKRVRVVMNENGASTKLLEADDVETLALDELIKSKVVAAAREIESRAPMHMVTAQKGQMPELENFNLEEKDGSYVGVVDVTDDVMRLLAIKMSDWERNGRLISEQDAAYAQQKSKWTGVRGTVERPVAALVHGASGELQLELYSSKSSDATLERCSYISWPEIASDGKISLCERLVEPIVYMTAALTVLTLGDSQTAAGLQSMAFSLAGIRTETNS